MDSQFSKMPEENLIHKENNKKKILQPIIAFTLSILPFFIVFLDYFPVSLVSYIVIVMILSPVVALILAIVTLTQGKEVIGCFCKIISIITIIISLIPIAFIVMLAIGLDFVMISYM